MDQLGGILILAVPVLLLLWLMSRTRKQQRELAQTQSEVSVGSRVMMTSGLYGEVTALLEDNRVEIEIAPGVRTQWVRQAIARIEAPDLPVTPDPTGPPPAGGSTGTESGPDARP